MGFVFQISYVLDGDTGIVAQPGVQSGISWGAHFLSLVDMQYHLRRWAQLGTRGNCRQLSGLEIENAVFNAITLLHGFNGTLIFMLTHSTNRCAD